MTHIITFNLMQLLVTGYAVWRGGAPERIVGLMLALASLASVLIPYPLHGYVQVSMPTLVIDLTLLGALVAVALLADRFWPLWLAAVHLMEVALHGVRAYDIAIWGTVYTRGMGAAAYVMLAVLAAGVFRHDHRSGEVDWTFQRRTAFDESASLGGWSVQD